MRKLWTMPDLMSLEQIAAEVLARYEGAGRVDAMALAGFCGFVVLDGPAPNEHGQHAVYIDPSDSVTAQQIEIACQIARRALRGEIEGVEGAPELVTDANVSKLAQALVPTAVAPAATRPRNADHCGQTGRYAALRRAP